MLGQSWHGREHQECTRKMKTIKILVAYWSLLSLVSCSTAWVEKTAKVHPNGVCVGSVNPHGVWSMVRHFKKAGIGCEVDGSGYPMNYKIYVKSESVLRSKAMLEVFRDTHPSSGVVIEAGRENETSTN